MGIATTLFSSYFTLIPNSRGSDFESSPPPLLQFDFSSKLSGPSSIALSFSLKKKIVRASIDGIESVHSSSLKSELDDDYVPMPIVLIDQDSYSDATMVQVSFGDRLGALIDTMASLKDLGLDVVKGSVTTEGSVSQTRFLLTQLATGRKVEDPDLLERIRLTIINNLLKYHPESSERLAMGEAFGIKAPEKKLDVDIATHIHVKDDGPKRSLLCIETADRPGLLLEVIKIMADININVESAEIDTEGLVAKDKFHVSYRGAALNSSLSQVLINCLRYYLRRPEADDDSLPPEEEKELKETLLHIIGQGKKVKFEQKIHPGILGGLVVEFAQKVFDMSIRTRARQMERFLRDPVNFDSPQGWSTYAHLLLWPSPFNSKLGF